MARTQRKRLLRTVISEEVNHIKDWALIVRALCTPPSMRYYRDSPDDERATWHTEPRKRSEVPDWEKIENNRDELERLRVFLAGIENVAMRSRLMVEERIGELDRANSALDGRLTRE